MTFYIITSVIMFSVIGVTIFICIGFPFFGIVYRLCTGFWPSQECDAQPEIQKESYEAEDLKYMAASGRVVSVIYHE